MNKTTQTDNMLEDKLHHRSQQEIVSCFILALPCANQAFDSACQHSLHVTKLLHIRYVSWCSLDGRQHKEQDTKEATVVLLFNMSPIGIIAPECPCLQHLSMISRSDNIQHRIHGGYRTGVWERCESLKDTI